MPHANPRCRLPIRPRVSGWGLGLLVAGFLGLFAAVAQAHPHEWYDLRVEADLADGRGEAEIRLTLIPNAFTHSVLVSQADVDANGQTTVDELASLTAIYGPTWTNLRSFTHPEINHEIIASVRGEPPVFELGTNAAGEPWIVARLVVRFSLAQNPRRINTVTVQIQDMSAYTALAIVPGAITARMKAPARMISVAQASRSKFHIKFDWRQPPPASTASGPASGANSADDGGSPVALHRPDADADADAPPTTVSLDAIPPDETLTADMIGERTWGEWVQESAAWAQQQSYDRFVKLRDGLDLGILAVLMAVAALWGILHAMGPGHGKGLVAAFLVRTEGRIRDAVKLGVLIAYVHTGSAVLLVGAVRFAASFVQQKQFLDNAEGWLGFGSGFAIIGLGCWLLYERLGGHDHADDDHRLRGADIKKIAVAAGIVPCPAATLIMLLAMSAGAFWIGTLVVVALAFGIALVLTGVGSVVVLSRRGLTAAVVAASHPTAESTSAATALRPAPMPAIAGLALAGARSDEFISEDAVIWLDDAPASGPASGDEFATADGIEWLDEPADPVADVATRDARPRALRILENVLGLGGAACVTVFGAGLVWYYATYKLFLL